MEAELAEMAARVAQEKKQKVDQLLLNRRAVRG
jgi:hypothetical protein